jgi:hypothetical protein
VVKRSVRPFFPRDETRRRSHPSSSANFSVFRNRRKARENDGLKGKQLACNQLQHFRNRLLYQHIGPNNEVDCAADGNVVATRGGFRAMWRTVF